MPATSDNNLLIQGNVGIGTTQPTHTLEVIRQQATGNIVKISFVPGTNLNSTCPQTELKSVPALSVYPKQNLQYEINLPKLLA